MAELTVPRAPIAAAASPRRWTATRAVVLIGEDVGAAGGVFKLTEGLFDEFGPERVRDTPISEQAIVGAAMGAAMTGLRPIAELMFCDFFAVTWDMVVNQIAKTRYMTDGQVSLPLVLRTANGAGLRFGAQHSQSIENWAMAIPGLKVVAPSTPADWSGLMAAAIRDPDPVIFCEHKALFATKGEVPDGEHRRHARARPRIVRPGRDATIVALAAMVPKARRGRRAAGRRARHRRRGHRPALARPARHRDDPRLGREDEPAVHGRGEPAAVRLGRRDRLDRRRRGLLQPRCADRPDHDAAHPAAVGGGARGPRDPVGRPDRRDRPAPPGRCRVRRRAVAEPTVAVLGTGRMGSAMAERLAEPGLDGRRLQPDAGAGGRAGRADRRDGRRHRRPRPPRAPTSSSRWSPTTPRSATCTTGRTASPPGIRPGTVAVDMSTVLPDTIRAVAPAVRARGAGILDAPGLGQRHARPLAGELTLMVGGDGGRPRAGPAGPRPPRAARLPPRRRSAPARR